MKKIRLVVCDLDGTLLNEQKQISVATQKKVDSLTEKGIQFTFCTGRIASMIPFYIAKLGVTTPVITANGAAIWDPVAQQMMDEQVVAPEVVKEIISYCRKYEIDWCVLSMAVSYFAPYSKRRKRFEQYNLLASAAKMPEMALYNLADTVVLPTIQGVHKILLQEPDVLKLQQAQSFLDTLPAISHTSSECNLVDIAAAGVSKGSGLVTLKKYLGMEKEEVAAFGDYINDIDMLKEAGVGIAMGNGCLALRKMANYITLTNEEDGVVYGVDKYIL